MDDKIIVAVLTIIGSLYVFYHKIKKNIKDEEEKKIEPMIELNKSIIELNSTIKYWVDEVKSLKDKVKNQENDIANLKLTVQDLKTKVHVYHESN